MVEAMQVNVVDVVGSRHCVSVEDGLRVHDLVLRLLNKGSTVVLSFEKADTVISAFLNASIGKLFGDLPAADVDARLQVRNVNTELLERIKQNAIRYYNNPTAHQAVIASVIGDEG